MTDLPIPEGDLTAAESEELLLLCGHAPGPEPLSPAAHAVVGAAHAVDWVNRRALAAALRAAALYCKRDTLIMLSLADELEGT